MTVTTAPVTKTIEVECSVERAFEVFTGELGDWWPLATHQIQDGRSTQAFFEPAVGGRVYERAPDGSEADWGEVLVYDPPIRLAFTWRVTSEPTEVEVRFVDVGRGRTRVDLEHRNWERLGTHAESTRSMYDTGWDGVLALFAARTT